MIKSASARYMNAVCVPHVTFITAAFHEERNNLEAKQNDPRHLNGKSKKKPQNARGQPSTYINHSDSTQRATAIRLRQYSKTMTHTEEGEEEKQDKE